MATSVGSIFTGETDTSVDQSAAGANADLGFEQEDPNGKYLLLGLNGFPGNPSTQAIAAAMYPDPTMASYIRLGTARAGIATPRTSPLTGPGFDSTGDDLARLALGPDGTAFADDRRAREQESDAPQETGLGGTGLSAQSLRLAESSMLLTRGGWRDHTDGNRITTTRGDKVEVIRGNYKLLVLGRQNPATAGTNVSGVDMSGGCIDSDPADLMDPGATLPGHSPQLNVEYTWHQDDGPDGLWYWKQTTTQGSQTPGPNGNGQIVSNTWVDLQETNLGTQALPVNEIIQSTFATTMNQSTTVTGTSTTINNVSQSVTFNTFDNNSTTIVTGPTLIEQDHANTILLHQIADMILSILEGMAVDVHLGLHEDLHVGAHGDQHVGIHNELHLGLHDDVHLGAHVDPHIGPHVESHIGPHIDGAEVSIETHNAHVEIHTECACIYQNCSILYSGVCSQYGTLHIVS